MKKYTIPFVTIVMVIVLYLYGHPTEVKATQKSMKNPDANATLNDSIRVKYSRFQKLMTKQDFYNKRIEDLFWEIMHINGCINNTTSRIQLYIYTTGNNNVIISDTVQASCLVKYKNIIRKYEMDFVIDSIFNDDKPTFNILHMSKYYSLIIKGDFYLKNSRNNIVTKGKFKNKGELHDYLFGSQDSYYSNSSLDLEGEIQLYRDNNDYFHANSDISEIGLPKENLEFQYSRMGTGVTIKGLPEWADYNTNYKWWQDSAAQSLMGF